jgi:hypothetical protein
MDAVSGSAETHDPQSLQAVERAVAGRKHGLRMDGVWA